MATKQEQVLAAVVKNKDFGEIIGEDSEIFGPFADTVDFMRDFYYQHGHTPSRQIVNDRFSDVELPETTAPTRYYLDELRKEHLHEKLNGILLGASKALDKQSPEDVISRMQTSLTKLERFSGGVQDVDLADVDDALRHFRKVKDAREAHTGLAGIQTDLKSWDSSLPNGIGNGDNVLLLG